MTPTDEFPGVIGLITVEPRIDEDRRTPGEAKKRFEGIKVAGPATSPTRSRAPLG